MALAFPVLLLSVLLSALCYLIIQPFFTSPLRHVPAAHPLCRITSAWILWKRFRHVEIASIKRAHERLGPVVLLGPKEVSINCIKGGLSVVYTGGMEKGWWYEVFANYGVPNMFSTPGSKAHSQRKRILSNTYSKSYIQSSAPLQQQTIAILHGRLFPLLSAICDPNLPPSAPYQTAPGVVDIYPLVSGLTMDIVTAYLYGLSASSKFTSDPAACKHFLDLYNSRHGFTYWLQETPNLLKFASMLKLDHYLVPQRVADANHEMEEWCMEMCNNARKTLDARSQGAGKDIKPQDVPVVYQQIATAIARGTSKALDASIQDPYFPTSPDDQHTAIASETFDHLAAGFDTSGITLTYLIHELSLPHNKHLQESLRKELLTLSPTLKPYPKDRNNDPQIPDSKTLDALPLLHAILWETLRLHPAIPGPEPRVTPKGGCVVGPGAAAPSGPEAKQDGGQRAYEIPGGVRISASAGILHQNGDVFSEPEKWRPERWLDGGVDEKERKEMDRWFWAFGSGGRMCVGSNLAIYQMKFITAAIYTNYSTSIVDDEGIEQEDAYTARPKSQKLIVKLEPVSS